MDNDKLLQALSEMMDTKFEERLQALSEHLDNKLAENLQPINERLDKIEDRLDKMDGRLDKIENRLDMVEVIQKRTTKKLDDLQLDIKLAERDIRRDIHDLNDEMETVIEILKMNDMLPR